MESSTITAAEVTPINVIGRIADVDIANAPTATLRRVNDELRHLMGAYGARGWVNACQAAHDARQPVSDELVARILAEVSA